MKFPFFLISTALAFSSPTFADEKDKVAELAAQGSVALEKGDYQLALRKLNEALRLYPGAPNLVYRWRGLALAGTGKHKKAISDFNRIIANSNESAELRIDALLDRAQAHQNLRDFATALNDFEAALKLSPRSATVLNDFAWFLATVSNNDISDGARGIELANRAATIMGEPHPSILDTLSACYAAMGNFKLAISIQEKAIKLSDSSHTSEKMKARLNLYQNGKRHVETY